MKTLVVARWIEDVGWTERLPDGWVARIVQKGRDLPNLGREPASFLWAILDLYDRVELDDVLGFVQGDPFPHTADLFQLLTQPVDGFVPLIGDASYGVNMLWSDADGNPYHIGVPVGRLFERWLGRPFPGQVPFWAGGQFMVSGRRLKSHDRVLYQRMLTDLLEDGDLAPWALERLWPSIFDGAL